MNIDWGWSMVAISGLSGLIGGIVGGWIMAFRIGSWRQRVEDRLDQHDARLANGTPRVRAIPVLETKLEVLLEEVRGLKAQLRESFSVFQTKETCEAKHGAER